MEILTKTTVTQKTVTDIICDCCGKSCWDKQKMNYEIARLHATWGYYSRKDGTYWNCDLCEDCADKFREWVEGLGGKIQVAYY